MNSYKKHPASYRDPSGFVFEQEGKLYRQVNQAYAIHYDRLMQSGLYDLLVQQKKMIPHIEMDSNLTGEENWYRTLLPEQLPYITYPYEWCFSQWKQAALLTLNLVEMAMQHGMILKDATPFNIQFRNGLPVLIDSLSFEQYNDKEPWVAYQQFITNFIGPLILARYRSPVLLRLFQLYPNGIPLPLIAQWLPFKSKFNWNVFLHIGLPRLLPPGNPSAKKRKPAISSRQLLGIIRNLYSFVEALSLPASVTQWNQYYDSTILSREYAEAKMQLVKAWMHDLPVRTVLDWGTNTGMFAKEAVAAGKYTIAVDADMACIERLYLECLQQHIVNLLPLCMDIANPSPAIGWDNAERPAFLERMQTDLSMALALIHHLVIGRNISFEQIAGTFSRFSSWLIIEFVPKADPKVQLLLRERADIFDRYSEAFFVAAFEQKFTIVKREMVPATDRVLFLMQRK